MVLNSMSTKVFQDMINGLGAYVQNIMMLLPQHADGDGAGGGGGGAGGGSGSSPHHPPIQGPSSSNLPGGVAGGTGAGPGVNAQPGFYYRKVWKPLTLSFVGGQTKELFLDVGERHEVPAVSDGYGISLAYACLLDVVRSVSLIINQNAGEAAVNPSLGDDDKAAWRKQIVDSSWCGILSALSLLLDASTDDTSTENILKAFETYASICGQLGLSKPRDAFLASLCKASLPPHYTLNVLKATPCTQTVSGPKALQVNYEAEADIRHQVVAVGEFVIPVHNCMTN